MPTTAPAVEALLGAVRELINSKRERQGGVTGFYDAGAIDRSVMDVLRSAGEYQEQVANALLSELLPEIRDYDGSLLYKPANFQLTMDVAGLATEPELLEEALRLMIVAAHGPGKIEEFCRRQLGRDFTRAEAQIVLQKMILHAREGTVSVGGNRVNAEKHTMEQVVDFARSHKLKVGEARSALKQRYKYLRRLPD